MKKNSILNSTWEMWNRLPVIVRSIVSGLFVSSIGVFIWGALLRAIPCVWVVLPMAVILWVYGRFYSGAWGTKHLAGEKKERFRSVTALSAATWRQSLIAACLFVVIVQASFVVTFRLIPFPSTAFTADYKQIAKFPVWAAWLVIMMASVVAGICEETGFRGYMQVPLEKRYGYIKAILVTSLVFTLVHLGHSWASPILPHIFFASVLLGILAYRSKSLIPGIVGHSILDMFDYSIWWTNLCGGFTRKTIFATGLDAHFVAWVFIFIISIAGFFVLMNNLKK